MNAMGLRVFTNIAIILALIVILLGAYTRLTDAGLGCPDWPGCYGRMVLPVAQDALFKAQLQFPQVPIEPHKAWTEMVHRYAAGTLGFLILLIFISSRKKPCSTLKAPRILPKFLLILVIFQAMLGMWTVTLKLLPIVVMSHLLGGMLIFASLCALRCQLASSILVHSTINRKWRFFIGIAIMLAICQIALGGWVSANYAGIACIGFPKCNGGWIPPLQFTQGFNLFSPIGVNYQGGVLDNAPRATIQFIHRCSAIILTLYIFLLGATLWKTIQTPLIRRLILFVMFMISVQFTLGVLNVVYLLPLWVAIAHNAGAAILLAGLFSLYHFSSVEK